MKIKVGGTAKAAVQMDNDLRDEGMGVIRCADRGDTLVIHEIRNNGTLVVSKQGNEYQFVCALDEISDT